MVAMQQLPVYLRLFLICAEDVLPKNYCSGAHLFDFHILYVEFPSADNLHSSPFAFGALIVALLKGKKDITVPAAQLSRDMRMGANGSESHF
jgi:hypothetical protein